MKLFDFIQNNSEYFWQNIEKTLEGDYNHSFIDSIPDFINKVSLIINMPNFVNNLKRTASETHPESNSFSMKDLRNIPSMKCILLMDKWIDNIQPLELRIKTLRWWRKVGIRNPHKWYSINSDSKKELQPFPEYVIDYISKCSSDFQFEILEKILKVEQDILVIEKSNWKQIFKLRYESFYYSTIWLLYQERLQIFGTDSIEELAKYIDIVPLQAYVGTLLDDSFDYEEDIEKGQKTLFTCPPFEFNTESWTDFINKIMITLEPLLHFDISNLPLKYKLIVSKFDIEMKNRWALYPHTYRNTKSLSGTILYSGLFLLISNITNKENLKNQWQMDIKEIFKDISL
jgi:hypothetical protein